MNAKALAKLGLQLRKAQKEHARSRTKASRTTTQQLEAQFERVCQAIRAGKASMFPAGEGKSGVDMGHKKRK